MALPAKETTTKTVVGIRFGFYTDEEVKKMSVKRIISPLIFDNLKAPLPQGLYDPAMGPLDPHGRCTTCELGASQCPGHLGHIELPLPVYNPMIFATLYRLLRNTCFYCFQFKMGRDEMDKFVAKLSCLAQGDLVGAVSITLGSKTPNKDLAEILESTSIGQESYKEPSEHETKKASGKGRSTPATSTALEAMREVIQEFYSRLPKGKCANCSASSPNVKKQGHTRLFKVWATQKAIVQNQLKGIQIKSVLDQPDMVNEVAALEDEMTKELEEKKKSVDGKKKRVAEEEGGEMDDKPRPFLDQASRKENDEFDDEQERVMEEATRAEASKSKASEPDANNMKATYMTPLEAEEIMRRLWRSEGKILGLIFAAEEAGVGLDLDPRVAATLASANKRDPLAPSHSDGFRMFFVRVLPVIPNKFRPPSKVGEEMFEHAQNVVLAKILSTCLELTGGSASSSSVTLDEQLGRSLSLWLQLQNSVNGVMDSTVTDSKDLKVSPGIRQVLEKKEGLFRKNMMGKRVNYAARSVISPDPYIGAGEIGVPPYFAKRLSFPERVTPWNVEKLREAVIRGSDELPGAVAVEDERGVMVSLCSLDRRKREAIAKQLLGSVGTGGRTNGARGGGGAQGTGLGKIVYRHLRDGDLMLTNRQPTLHKPGLMAHRARVLKGERTIRMHYANCSTFNADFDGDEINLHLPQDHLGRAEGYEIVHADHQYIVPTDGKPIRGLIQDHVCGATLITSRDAFFTRSEYAQLVYLATTPWLAGKGAGAHPHLDEILLDPPTIVKPRPLWTGKQVLSTVVRNFTQGLPPLTFSGKAKVPADYWGGGKGSGEGELIFRKGYLMCGIMDKNQFAKYGLVHSMHELYGDKVAGQMLNSFSRLFTHFLQWNGFTCGMDDLLLTAPAEKRRQDLLDLAEVKAIQASAEFVGAPLPPPLASIAEGAPTGDGVSPPLFRLLLDSEAKTSAALSERYRSNADTGKAHDMKGSGVMHKLSSSVVGTCLPSGQSKAFPRNCLSLMTITGAKGSMVNFSQISCLLGQQELEGRRPPRMASGKTLPCFEPFDAGARSCGFVGDRFFSGLRPQEYYFHCMAGREGLIDTAVKTSRSGYLQRCLVKNLESLRVHYDGTVRDNCDGSVVQFMYGEDGLDVTGASYMRQFAFLADNAKCFAKRLDLDAAVEASGVAGLKKKEKKVKAALEDRAEAILDGTQSATDPPLSSQYPFSVLGSVSESFADSLASFARSNAGKSLLDFRSPADGEGKKSKKAKKAPSSDKVDPETFIRLMQLKFLRGQVSAGEAVGVLAAQSVGEPSTQMTLNTFHMAGRGEANVTLGIPRLREILMTAASKIKTPVMTLRLNQDLGSKEAHVLANRLRRLRLAETLAGILVNERPVAKVEGIDGSYGRLYHIKLQFHAPDKYPKEASLGFDELSECFRGSFCPKLRAEVEKEVKKRSGSRSAVAIGRIELSSLREEEEGAASRGGGGGGGDEEAGETQGKKKGDKDDDLEDADDDEEMREGKLRFRGGRKEEATYDAPDEEEEGIERAVRKEAMRRIGEEEEEEGDGEEAREDLPALPLSAARASGGSSGKNVKEGAGSAVPSSGIDEENFCCSLTITLPLNSPKLLMLEIVERVAASTMLRTTDHIDKVYVIEPPGEVPKVQTDGINFLGAWLNPDIVDVNEVVINDVAAMLRTLGVEAARATVMREVSAVFNAYGIGVDPRHLCLLADFMTHQGGYRACNRMGIESSVSPFLKMSFETATHFLTDATLKGSFDDLKSPSARLCVGRVVEVGTGCLDLLFSP